LAAVVTQRTEALDVRIAAKILERGVQRIPGNGTDLRKGEFYGPAIAVLIGALERSARTLSIPSSASAVLSPTDKERG
jgi:hypothetical protein